MDNQDKFELEQKAYKLAELKKQRDYQRKLSKFNGFSGLLQTIILSKDEKLMNDPEKLARKAYDIVSWAEAIWMENNPDSDEELLWASANFGRVS